FSLGCTLFRLLTGRVPFDGANPVEKLVARYTEDAPLIRTVRPEAPQGLEFVIAKMTAREPKDRFQTPLEVAHALAPFAAGMSSDSSQPVARPPVIRQVQEGLELIEDDDPASADTRDFINLLAMQAGESSTSESASDMDTLDAGRGVLPQPRRSPRVSRAQSSRWTTWAILGGLAALLFGAGWLGYSSLGKTQVVLEWSLDDRRDCVLIVDGTEIQPADYQRLTFPGDPGERSVIIRRQDYKPFKWRATIGWGEQKVVRPAFEMTVEGKWSRDFASLGRHAENTLAEPPLRKQLPLYEALILKLDQLVRSGTDGPKVQQARTFSARLQEHVAALDVRATPLDQLRRENLPPQAEFAAGDAPVVGVLGDLRFKHSRAVTAAAFSPDGRALAVASGRGDVILWDMETQTVAGRINAPAASDGASVYQLAFSPDGSQLASLGHGIDGRLGGARLWNVETGEQVSLATEQSSGPLCLAFWSRPNGETQLLTGHVDGFVRFWNPRTGDAIHAFQAHPRAAMRLAVNDGGQSLASMGSDGLKMWNLGDGQPGEAPPLHVERYQASSRGVGFSGLAAWSLAFQPQGNILVSLGRDRVVKFRNAATGEELYRLRTGANLFLQKVVFSPDGQTLALHGRGAAPVKLWDMQAKREIRDVPAQFGYCSAVAFQPTQGDVLAVADGTRIKFVRVGTGRELFRSQGHDSPISSLVFHDDEETLVTLGDDGEIMFWDASNGELLSRSHLSRRILAAEFTRDGDRFVALGSDRRLLTGATDNSRLDVLGSLRFTAPSGVFSLRPSGNRVAVAVRSSSSGSHAITVRNRATGAAVHSMSVGKRQPRRLF
ncbi:MAG: hypothetical protein N2C14_29110, partial [Planctomycetales bacterium]